MRKTTLLSVLAIIVAMWSVPTSVGAHSSSAPLYQDLQDQYSAEYHLDECPSHVVLSDVPAGEFSQVHNGSNMSIICRYTSYQNGVIHLSCADTIPRATSTDSKRTRKYRHRVRRMNKLSRSALGH